MKDVEQYVERAFDMLEGPRGMVVVINEEWWRNTEMCMYMYSSLLPKESLMVRTDIPLHKRKEFYQKAREMLG